MKTTFGSLVTRFVVCGALSVTLVAQAADAPPGDKSVTQKILDKMREAGQIDEETHKAWSEEAAEEESAKAGTASSEDDPKGWKAYWKNGTRIERNDGAFKLKIGGRVHLDMAGISESREIKERFDGEGIGAEFRRARFSFSGSVFKYGIFKAQYDYADNSPEFKDVYMGLQKLPYVGRIKIGHMKEPFSLEELTSSNDITFLERSLVSAENPVRNTGIMMDRNFLEGDRMWFALGGFFDSNDFGDSFSRTRNYNISTRLTGLPIYQEEGGKLLHLGAAYNRRFTNDVRLRQRPEAHLAPRYVDTGSTSLAVDDVDLVNGEVAAVFGPFSIQGEVTSAFANQKAGDNLTFWGFYTEASYFFTGEHRVYDKKTSVFKNPKPINNFDPANGTYGAFQGTFRFSYLDLDDRNILGGRLQDITAGLNWYLFPSMRVMLNYVHSFITPSTTDNILSSSAYGHADIFQARFQWAFQPFGSSSLLAVPALADSSWAASSLQALWVASSICPVSRILSRIFCVTDLSPGGASAACATQVTDSAPQTTNRVTRDPKVVFIRLTFPLPHNNKTEKRDTLRAQGRDQVISGKRKIRIIFG